MFSANDKLFMKRGLQLARLGGVKVAPNPMVGAVIVHNSKIIGEGYHEQYGQAHAEVNAINSVEDKSVLNAATIYVTLEPCAHYGKTPPCSDLIIEHGFERVVVACIDSFSAVAGKGIEKMKNAGINVEVGLLEKEAREVNKRFFTYHEKNRPYIILKWAQTQDGFIDRLPEERENGVNWITTPIMKTIVHKWRATEPAILVGWKTVANDNPSLTVREIEGVSPKRFIIDPECKTPLDSKIMTDGGKTCVLVEKNTFDKIPESVEVVEIQNYVISELLTVLFNQNILSVFIEGGSFTLQSFINEGFWDEARVLTGPAIFNQGIKAPIISNGFKEKSEQIEDNHIYYFRNS